MIKIAHLLARVSLLGILMIGSYAWVGSAQSHEGHLAPEEFYLDLVNNYGTYLEESDWRNLSKLLARRLVIEENGAVAVRVSRREFIARWSSFIPGFDYVDYSFTDSQVSFEEDLAIVTTSLRALHTIAGASGGEDWTVMGSYQFEVFEGKITRLRLNVTEGGNQNLAAQARSRVLR